MRDKLRYVQVFYPLGQKNISIQMINQGASQISIMIGTRRGDAEEVIRTIYQTFLIKNILKRAVNQFIALSLVSHYQIVILFSGSSHIPSSGVTLYAS